MSRRSRAFPSARTLKRVQLASSAGIGCVLVQRPQAYWKKSSQGDTLVSIDAVSTPGGAGGAGACAGADALALAVGAAGGGGGGAGAGCGGDAPHARANGAKETTDQKSARRAIGFKADLEKVRRELRQI